MSTHGEQLIEVAIANAIFWGWKDGYGDSVSQVAAYDKHQQSLKDLKEYVLRLERKK